MSGGRHDQWDQDGRFGPAIVDIETIKDGLLMRLESLIHEIFPNARKEGHEMCVGSIAGEPGQSLRINISNGPRRGYCRDFSANQSWDPLNLVRDAMMGGDKGRAVAWAKSWLGLDGADPARLARHRIEVEARAAERRAEAEAERIASIERARRRWHEGAPIAGTLVETYLRSRAIDLRALGRAPGAIRFNPALQYGWQGPKLPAMVAMITLLDGSHCGTHCTWLALDGRGKAGADILGLDRRGRPNDAKKVRGQQVGGHIPVWKGAFRGPLREIPAGTDVYVSEGIEDGLTAACADPTLRIVAMMNVGNFLTMELPPQMGRLILLRQNDPPGSDAARTVREGVKHHRAQGRKVLFVDPPAGTKDLNDLAQAGQVERGGN